MPYKYIKHPYRDEKEPVSLKSAVDKIARNATSRYGGVAENADAKAEKALDILACLLDELSDKRELLTDEQWARILDGYDSDRVVWVDAENDDD